ncbi:polysaccharide deacetylase family sporulation protein PdaB [Desnuesiella massiliensis]|uniref:polysaccharide deacetylase family sporulation protein PdaB n=1 Tax=Desnuesiella massiliensis TaxID=1650662 RepID=UPI000B24CB32
MIIRVRSFIFKKGYIGFLLFLLAVAATLVFQSKVKAVFNITRKLPIYSVDTKEKKISLTFDLSWGEDNTMKILDVLDQYKVKATFFVVGGWIDYTPKNELLIKEIDKRGHEIGNHSNMHPDMTKISRERIIKEIEVADTKIMNLTGKNSKLFRCPSGAYNDLVISTVESMKRFCIQWDVDSIDWKSQGAEIEYNRVITKTKPGSILLFHNDAKYTPQNLPRIIEKLKKDGYEFVMVSNLIYKENYYINSEGKQILK